MFKKTIISMCVLFCSLAVNAQESTTNVSNVSKESTSFAAFGLGYYGFDGMENYGLTIQGYNVNGASIDVALRANFEDHGNYNIDFGVNYTFGLYQKDDLGLYLTLAAGPSFRTQDQLDGFDKHDNPKYKSKIMVDGFVNGRLSVKYKAIMLSGGYYYWAPKFKFGKDYKADGVNVALAYCF